MGLSANESALIERFNAATNAVAAKIRDLVDNPPADDADFNAALGAIATQLEAIGANGQTPPPVV